MNNKNVDQQLVAQLLHGDEETFGRFFDEYFPRLHQFALVRLKFNEDYADEVVQSTLAKAMYKLDSYRGEAPLFSWLCTFCRHEIHALLTREGRLGLPNGPIFSFVKL